MTKSDLSLQLSKEMNLPLRKSEEIVDSVFATMFNALSDQMRIEIRGFGSFEVRKYGGYKGRNPKTGEHIAVTEKRLPFFKAGKELKSHVDEAGAGVLNVGHSSAA
jgi:integration host factor subunit beta